MKLDSKGQVTLPKAVRDALGLREGDRVVFRVEGSHAVLVRAADLLDLAGVVPVPPAGGGADWKGVIDQTRRARATRFHHDSSALVDHGLVVPHEGRVYPQSTHHNSMIHP